MKEITVCMVDDSEDYMFFVIDHFKEVCNKHGISAKEVTFSNYEDFAVSFPHADIYIFDVCIKTARSLPDAITHYKFKFHNLCAYANSWYEESSRFVESDIIKQAGIVEIFSKAEFESKITEAIEKLRIKNGH